MSFTMDGVKYISKPQYFDSIEDAQTFYYKKIGTIMNESSYLHMIETTTGSLIFKGDKLANISFVVNFVEGS